MIELAIALRTAQLTAHNMHNCVRGQSFFSDHAHLEELYQAYEEAYDETVEQTIGLGLAIDLNEVAVKAAAQTASQNVCDMSANEMFALLLTAEYNIRVIAESFDSSADYGTKNFLQDIAMKSLRRCYKIGQRLKV